ncbi:ABC transporter permease/substrate-binding protein [Chitinophagaceae bacterium MMS25-I14]
MDRQQTFWQYIAQQSEKLMQQTLQHVGLTFISLFIALLIGIPAGIFIARRKKFAPIILNTTGVLQTIPSLALLGFMIPLAGIGPVPAIIALFLYALLPIVRNTFTGITEVNGTVKEAAVAMGMNRTQVLFRVELPLAFPVIMAGIRTATVINVGVATLAAYIAAGGLGEFIFGGIALNNTYMILAGAIPAALLAILLDFLLSRVQHMKLRRKHLSIFAAVFAIVICSSFYTLPVHTEGKLLAGFTPEFMGRRDGDLGLRQVYKLRINTVVISDAVMYKAAQQKKLDVISGYSTDGRLKAYDLITLKDDRNIFPPYYAAPLVRKDVLQKYPEIATTLNLLAGKINDSVMTSLNYKVDYLQQSPEDVAKQFLVTQGLWKAPREVHKATVRIGSKVFTEQYILLNMYAMLLKGYTDLDVESKTGLGGTKICFEALRNNAIDLYPEYTGTGFLVLLHPSDAVVAAKTISPDSVYDYVQKEFNGQYNLEWLRPVGFNNAYALMMRRQQASALHLETISQLASYLNTHQ